MPDLTSAKVITRTFPRSSNLLLLTAMLSTAILSKPAFSQAQSIESIAQHRTWWRLTHLEKRASGFRTDIQSPEFYLSESPLSPLHELKATIAAFSQPSDLSNENHAVCRFPARYYWLKQHLPDALKDAPSTAVCTQLKEWPALKSGTSLNLVHVSGYMGNPGSAFGHLLLRAGKKDDDNHRGLLDTGINFGAKIPPGENTVVYIIKGVGGGYSSSFSADRHYLRDHVYAASEARDMWAYDLNLSDAQRQLLLLHLWELRETEFNYFFLKKNCAWRVAQLLELILDKRILPRHRPYYMPIDVFHAVQDLDNDKNLSLINKVSFLPSDKRSITLAFDNLDEAAKLRMRDLISNPRIDAMDQGISTAELDLLIDHSAQVLAKTNQPDITTAWKQLRQKALLLRLKSKAKAEPTPEFSLPAPGEGLRHQILQLTTYSENQGTELSFAPFSYELLDRNRGSLSNGEFRGGVFTFSRMNGNTHLKSLDVLKVARVRGTSRLDSRMLDTAWRGGLQLNREWPGDLGKLVPQFYAAVGKTIGKGQTSAFAMLEINTSLKDLSVQGGFVVGAVSKPGNQWSYNWESSRHWDEHSDQPLTRHQLNTRYRINRSHAIDLGVERQLANSWKLSYQFRW